MVYDSYSSRRIGTFAKLAFGSVITLALGGCLTGGCVLACNITSGIEYSQGTRTGMVNKVSKKGLIWKTDEGQMALEGIASQGTTIGANVWDFSIDRARARGEKTEELVGKLRKYLESGIKVKIDYVEVLESAPWRASTDYFIQNVEPVGQKSAEKQQ
ncbi:MAG: hypothetical protein AABX29_10050 [Nanoarchaeota archaeon]